MNYLQNRLRVFPLSIVLLHVEISARSSNKIRYQYMCIISVLSYKHNAQETRTDNSTFNLKINMYTKRTQNTFIWKLNKHIV